MIAGVKRERDVDEDEEEGIFGAFMSLIVYQQCGENGLKNTEGPCFNVTLTLVAKMHVTLLLCI